MDEFVKQLSKEFDYERHEIKTDLIQIYVRSNRTKVRCPYCGAIGRRIHSWYKRRFQDLPMQGKKVEIVLKNRKYYCSNLECKQTTFAETFDCVPFKGKRSERLTASIIDISLNMSSVKAASILKKGTADVGKSTICNLIKKGLTN